MLRTSCFRVKFHVPLGFRVKFHVPLRFRVKLHVPLALRVKFHVSLGFRVKVHVPASFKSKLSCNPLTSEWNFTYSFIEVTICNLKLLTTSCKRLFTRYLSSLKRIGSHQAQKRPHKTKVPKLFRVFQLVLHKTGVHLAWAAVCPYVLHLQNHWLSSIII